MRGDPVVAEQFDERQSPARHPLGNSARVLLTSVFGPFAQDDDYGSRKLNPIELWHNQVTRTQGVFSLRMFNRSWGLMLIQANIDAPCALLDFPTLDRFTQEISDHRYDIVGISGIPPNIMKIAEMCRRIRRLQPQATIVIGGHVANIPDLRRRVDADWIVRGDGVHWFRNFLGDDVNRPIRHPMIDTCIATRTMGRPAGAQMLEPTATLIPSVGCPLGCNFCATSAMFGGKGRYVSFYEDGDELFEIMCSLEAEMGVQSFFVMDENFLIHRPRALRLLELMEQHDKAWSLQVFSSAKVVNSYTIDQLIRLGLSWLWLGLEGENSAYAKLSGVDTFALVRNLQAHGVRVLGSTIIGLEHHTADNIDGVIDHAVRHGSAFHQFMLYSPSPGTPFYDELSSQGLLKSEQEFPWADWHGQRAFSWRHPSIKDGQETDFIVRAFDRDFEVNGPSVLRVIRTVLNGWKRYKDHADVRVRRRFLRESRSLAKASVAMVAAARAYFRDNAALCEQATALLEDLIEQFGDRARYVAETGGPLLLDDLRAEERRLAAGWSYEPPTFYEINAACRERFGEEYAQAGSSRFVVPSAQRTAARIDRHRFKSSGAVCD